MSIRLKLLFGCLALTIVTIVVGSLAMDSQKQGSVLADRVFGEALIPLDRLREAQLLLSDVRGEHRPHAEAPAGAERFVLDPTTARQLAEISAILEEVSASVGTIVGTGPGRTSLDEAQAQLGLVQRPGVVMSERKFVDEMTAASDSVVAALADLRRNAGVLREGLRAQSEEGAGRMLQASGAAVLLSALITFLLSRAIVSPLRHAVKVAGAIADGRLDNEIREGGAGETAALLRSLKTMQTGIAEQFGRIEQLRRKQAHTYVETITTQNARFQAALDNMSQGLCLFDKDLKLIVYNSRFAEMFGERELGLTPERIKQDAFLRPTIASSMTGTFVETMPDGRTIALSRQGVTGGGLVVTLEDITERYQEDEVMRHLARHDALTDLPNRMQFREHLERTLARHGATVFGLDLDGFKTVNDTLGHPIGDKLLKEVSARLLECLEKSDMLARIGGDEFAIVLKSARGDAAAQALAQRLIDTIGRTFRIDGHEISIGVSIGVASGQASDSRTLADELIMHVDLALYSAKAEGKNTHRFFQKTMSDRLQRRRELEIDLRSAVDRGEELELFYQPFVDAGPGTISGFEALLRWRHPREGMVSPGEFVPIAEDVGLIHPIGLWVLRVACLQALDWPDHLTLSVNLSPLQFRNEDLLESVRRIVAETGFAPHRLQLEVTESLMLENPDAVLATLAAFRELGIRISMDDFGTGYSSLGYLTRYPFDKVKIDQSFVRDMHIPQNLAVIRSVISLSEALGMAVIAEGVETLQHYAALRDERCPEMQGYHFSRPVPRDEIPALLLKTFAASLGGAEMPRGEASAAA